MQSAMAEDLNGTFVIGNKTKETIFSEDSLVSTRRSEDSTRSLLTPLYASDYESIPLSSQSGRSSFSSDYSESNSSSTSPRSLPRFNRRVVASAKANKNNQNEKRKVTSTSNKKLLFKNESPQFAKITRQQQVFTKSWEEWVIEKTIDDLKKIQIRKEIRKRNEDEDRRKREEKRRKEIVEEDNRKRWISAKDYENEKRKKELAAQKEFETLKQRQRREMIEAKSREAFEKWKERKREMIKEQIAKEVRKRQEMSGEEIKRREQNKEAYDKWLEKVKKEKHEKKTKEQNIKPSNGDYFEKIVGAIPSYVNPIPWKGTLDKRHSMYYEPTRFRNGQAYPSPPLLWKEHEKRVEQSKSKHKAVSHDSDYRNTTSRSRRSKRGLAAQ